MGVDYYAKALIGCEVGQDKITQTTQQRGCKHVISASAKHCPECGKAAWYTEVRTDEEVDGIEHTVKDGLHFRSEEGRVIYLKYSTDQKRAFVGLYYCEADHYSGDAMVHALPDDDLKWLTRHALEPLGLWNGESFGLWAIQECSY